MTSGSAMLRRATWPLRSRWGRSLLYVLAAVIVFGVWLSPIRIRGISMFPTLVSEQIALVDRLAYRVREPERGDIVWIRGGAAEEPVYYVKRIVGLPGERLEFRAGRLFINGEKVSEDYTPANPAWWLVVPRIPAAGYYVVGDNRTMPLEDHYQGIVESPRVLGKVRFWYAIAPSRRRCPAPPASPSQALRDEVPINDRPRPGVRLTRGRP